MTLDQLNAQIPGWEFEKPEEMMEPGTYIAYAEEDNPDILVIKAEDVFKAKKTPGGIELWVWASEEPFTEENHGWDDDRVMIHQLDKFQARGAIVFEIKPK
jgi:hypothetical protein